MGQMINRRRYMGGGSPLPYDAEIEYLGFAQDCVVDTGIKPSTNYKYYWKYLWTGIRNWTYPFSNGGSRGNWFIFGGIENNFCTQLHIVSTAKTNGGILEANTLYDGSLMRNGSNMEEKLNNVLMVSLACNDFQSSENLNIIGTNITIWIYNFSIYNENDVLIRDLIPVRKGNTGYMYDRVSGQLFGNAGTGSFTLGPDKT